MNLFFQNKPTISEMERAIEHNDSDAIDVQHDHTNPSTGYAPEQHIFNVYTDKSSYEVSTTVTEGVPNPGGADYMLTIEW